MERRKFFKFLGLSTAAAAGGAVTAASLVASGRKTDAVKQIEKADNFALRINQDYGKNDLTFTNNHREAFRLDSTGTLHIGTSAPKVKLKTVSVDMVPGPDGELYLKTNGKWRKIVTE